MKTHTLPLTLGLWAATVAGAYFIGMQNRDDSLDVAQAGASAVGRGGTSTSVGTHVPITAESTAGAPWRADKESPSMPSAQAIANVRALYEGGGRGAQLASARGTAWGLLNGITESVDFHRRARSEDHRRDAAWFGQGAAIKQRAWDEVMKLVA